VDDAVIRNAIRTNALKSAAIVATFPLVLPSLLAAVVFAGGLLLGQPRAAATALQCFGVSLGGMLAVTLLWLPIGYVLNQWIVDQATGARLVSRSELPSVWASLDRLSQRAGLRPPALRLIATDALNAYASGLTAGSYCVTLTTGLVDTLDEDELEAVLAHELTHIVHQDVRLMVVAGVLVGTIPMLHDLAMKAFWAIVMGVLNVYRAIFTLLPLPGAKLLVGISYTGVYWAGRLVAYAIGLVATLCSLMLHFALSRKREFMADAGAVSLTGKPEALVSALRKISGQASLDTALAAVRAMCIENAVAWFGVFATHPPIADRIAALAGLAASHAAVDRPAGGEAESRRAGKMSAPATSEPHSPPLDPAMLARYRALLARATPERLDVIAREHLYRRARETVDNAPAQHPGITAREVALARAHLEAVITEIEAGLARSNLAPPALAPV